MAGWGVCIWVCPKCGNYTPQGENVCRKCEYKKEEQKEQMNNNKKQNKT